MTETMWKVLYELLRIHLCGPAGYASLWHLQDAVKVDLEGCGVPGDPAVMRLLEMGLIAELPDLPYRYRLVVTNDAINQAPDLATLRAKNEALREAAAGLIAYRDAAGPLNFQLEKADDFIERLRAALPAIG